MARVVHLVFVAASATFTWWYVNLEGSGTFPMAVYLIASTALVLLATALPAVGRLGVLTTVTTSHGVFGLMSPSAFGVYMVGVVGLGIAGAVLTGRTVEGHHAQPISRSSVVTIGLLVGVATVAAMFVVVSS